MFGYMKRKTHNRTVELLEGLHKAQVADMAERLNEAERKCRELDALASKFQDRAKRLESDRDALAAEIAENARFVDVGKKRLATLTRQNDLAKAKRRAGA